MWLFFMLVIAFAALSLAILHKGFIASRRLERRPVAEDLFKHPL
jgi:hypothetical protein